MFIIIMNLIAGSSGSSAFTGAYGEKSEPIGGALHGFQNSFRKMKPGPSQLLGSVTAMMAKEYQCVHASHVTAAPTTPIRMPTYPNAVATETFVFA
jgi:hypothetical protein